MRRFLHALGPHGAYSTFGALIAAPATLLAIAVAWPPIWWTLKLFFGWWFSYWQFCPNIEDDTMKSGFYISRLQLLAENSRLTKDLSESDRVNDALKAIIASQYTEIEALRERLSPCSCDCPDLCEEAKRCMNKPTAPATTRGCGWRSDCPACVASKFTCDEHYGLVVVHKPMVVPTGAS